MTFDSFASFAALVVAATCFGCGTTASPPTTPPSWQPSADTSSAVALPFGAPRFAVGTAWNEEQHVVLDGEVEGLRGLPSKAALRVETETLGRIEVVAVHAEGGMPTRVRIAVTKAAEHLQIGPKQSHSREAIEGHEYVALRDGDWSYERADGGSVSEEEADALNAFGLGWRLHPARLLPPRDVRPGDRLRLDESWLRHFGIEGRGLDDITVTFVGRAEDAGRFAIAGTFDKTSNDLTAKGPFDGALDLRLEDSWPLRLDLSSSLALSEADAETPGTGRATLTITWRAVPQ